MKQNFYDVFDHMNTLDADMPELREKPVNEKHLTDKVLAMADVKPVMNKRKSYRFIALAAAIAVTLGGTITAGALSGRMDEFFSSVSKSEIKDAQGTLPAVGTDSDEAMIELESYYSCPEVNFTGSDSGTVELLGMYNDNNSLMLSLSFTSKDGTLAADAGFLPYFTLTTADGEVKKLSESGSISQLLIPKDNSENTYTAVYYFTDPELAGGSLNVEIAGVYHEYTNAYVQERMHSFDESLRNEYAGDMTTDEWKQYQHENDFDAIRYEKRRELYAEEEAVINGAWNGDIAIPEAETPPTVLEHDGYVVTVDSLSVHVQEPEGTNHYSAEDVQYVDTVVYLKDDTAFYSNVNIVEADTAFENYPYVHGASSAGTDISNGRVYCFSRPISMDEIEKISIYTSDFSNGETYEYVIYK